MLSKDEIKKKRYELDQLLYELEKEHRNKVDEIDRQYRALYKECSHEDWDGAPYTRWCNTCGHSWDTT